MSINQGRDFLRNKETVFLFNSYGFLTSSATRLPCGRALRLMSDTFTCCHIETERGAGHIVMRLTQPVGILERGSNPRPPDQKSSALPTAVPLLAKVLRCHGKFKLKPCVFIQWIPGSVQFIYLLQRYMNSYYLEPVFHSNC